MKNAALACSVILALCACTTAATGSRAISVFAASSLQDVFPELADAYVDSGADSTLRMAFDGSSRLRAQIELGAHADLFLSANEENAAALADAGLAIGAPVAFAANRIVLVVPRGTPAVTRWQDLAATGTSIVAADAGVPITRYAEQVVRRLAALPSAPPRFAEAYLANVVSREDNVRAALAKVELGEADAALVYASDARSASAVASIALPDVGVVAGYWGIALGDPTDAAAAALLAWLRSPAAQAILTAHGFTPPP